VARSLPIALGCAVLALALPASAPATLTVTVFATDTGPGKIVVANDDGTGMRVLSNNQGSSYVSPDGARVAVNAFDQKSASDQATNFRLELFAAAGGLSRVIGTLCRPLVWSPDSTRIACVDWSDTRRPSHLLLIDPATGSTTTLVTGYLDSQVSFSPDSKRLAYAQASTEDYSTTGRLKVIDLTTRAVRTIGPRGAWAPAWGPTAIAFAIVKRHGRGFTFNTALIQPDGRGLRQLTHYRSNQELFGPYPVAWSADGKRLLAGMAGLDAWTFRESYAVDPIRGGSRLIAHRVAPSGFSRDGRFVIGQTGDAETSGLSRSNVVRVPWGGGARKILIRHAVAASFSG
jgi:hypothetical protein